MMVCPARRKDWLNRSVTPYNRSKACCQSTHRSTKKLMLFQLDDHAEQEPSDQQQQVAVQYM